MFGIVVLLIFVPGLRFSDGRLPFEGFLFVVPFRLRIHKLIGMLKMASQAKGVELRKM